MWQAVQIKEIRQSPPNFNSPPYYHKPVTVYSSTANAEITIAPQSTPESPDMLSKEKQFLFLLINGLIKTNRWGNIFWEHFVVQIIGSVIFFGANTLHCNWVCAAEREGWAGEEEWHRFSAISIVLSPI